jgi:hypothetical protein
MRRPLWLGLTNGHPDRMPETVLSGFREDDKALGRPVGLALDKQGALLVADDVGNAILAGGYASKRPLTPHPTTRPLGSVLKHDVIPPAIRPDLRSEF